MLPGPLLRCRGKWVGDAAVGACKLCEAMLRTVRVARAMAPLFSMEKTASTTRIERPKVRANTAGKTTVAMALLP